MEVNLSRKQIRKRKKKKQGKDVEHKDKDPHLLVDNTSLKTDATSKEVNSSQAQKGERKKKKRCKSVEDKKDKGAHVSLDNSSLEIDSTTEEINSSQKRKRERKNKKQGEASEHKPNGSYHLVENYSVKTDATIEDPLQEPQASIMLDSQETDKHSPNKKNKKRKRKKAKHHDIEYTVNSCGPPNDAFSLKASTSVLQRPAEHLIQFFTTDSVRGQSCLETDICQGENEVKEHPLPNKVAENNNVENDVQKLSCTCNTVVADVDCSAKESVLEVVELNQEHSMIDSSSNRKDNSDFVKNHANPGGQSKIPCLPVGGTITRKHFSKNKLLILDVNGLLADFASKVPKGSRPPDIFINGKKVYKRPFCDDFIKFCLAKFYVGVWSSRVKRNLDKAIKFLFGKSASKLLFCWNQSQCTKTKSFTLEDNHKPLVFKDLRKLWDKTVPNLPWEKGEFNESNTLLLDDSPYKALLNPRYTAIFPYSYHFDNVDDRSLARTGDLRVYLRELSSAENVQEYVSANPFGQEPITETSPSWDFYSNIIEAVKRLNDAMIQATSSRKRRRNKSSTALDQGTSVQPPSAAKAPHN